MNKNDQKQLRAAASSLIAKGAATWEPIVKQKGTIDEYYDQGRPINHYRRMKRFMKKNGFPVARAIKLYSEKFAK